LSRLRAAAGMLVATLLASPALAEATADYGPAFVAAFAEACVPGRLSYDGTRATAASAGWTLTTADAHAELAEVMSRSEKGALDPEMAEMDPAFEYEIYHREVAGQQHYLIVSLASFDMAEKGEAPDRWVYNGCYLYNFDAAAPIDPAPVGELTGKPIAAEINQDGMVSYTYGPPCPMPRTGDTYLTYVADDSPHKAATGFSGLMMKFDTSVPEPGEIVPDTYC
jgi:hypothetical protein